MGCELASCLESDIAILANPDFVCDDDFLLVRVAALPVVLVDVSGDVGLHYFIVVL